MIMEFKLVDGVQFFLFKSVSAALRLVLAYVPISSLHSLFILDI